MEEQLLTVGQFAKLASTTKRTVTWYDSQGILKPFKVDSLRYRLYKPEQIIDFQVILLLRSLNFSIEQIKEFLSKNASLKSLFQFKQKSISRDITLLERRLTTIKNYYKTFESEGMLVKPQVLKMPKTEIYYIQKEGPYSKIYRYGLELKSYFKNLPKNTQFITVYEDSGYKPVKSKFKVGVIRQKGMKLKQEASGKVLPMSIPEFKALVYTFKGSPSLLSFHWKQLEKYAALHKLKPNTSLPFIDVEIYKKSGFIRNIEEDQVVTDMIMPLA